MLQEFAQRRFLFLVLHKVLRHAGQFRQVLQPVLRLRCVLQLQLRRVTRLLHHVLHQLLHRHLIHLAHQLEQQRAELVQRLHKAAAKPLHLRAAADDLEQRLVMLMRIIHQALQRCRANPAPRDVDDAPQAELVRRVVQHL